MAPGDYILFYQSGRFVCVGEISHKLSSRPLAHCLWGTAPSGETWENIYFIINEKHISVDLAKFNELFGFSPNFKPQGFAQILSDRQSVFERHYGDVYDVMIRLDRGDPIREKAAATAGYKLMYQESFTRDSIEEPRPQTPHTEIQWRLLQMGLKSKNEVWVARNDRSKSYEGRPLSDGSLEELPQLGLDPDTSKTVELIDTIWLKGRRVTSAFEVENSTSIYSGILRLADLKAQAPNLTFPLFIVAPDDRRDEVMRQLSRPTFSALSVASSTKYLSYSRVRELGERYVDRNLPITSELLDTTAESVPRL